MYQLKYTIERSQELSEKIKLQEKGRGDCSCKNDR